MADTPDMIVPLLREMRAESAALHGETGSRLLIIEKRLEKIEQAQISYRQALTADSLLSKLVTGEFEERIDARKRQMRLLESQK